MYTWIEKEREGGGGGGDETDSRATESVNQTINQSSTQASNHNSIQPNHKLLLHVNLTRTEKSTII